MNGHKAKAIRRMADKAMDMPTATRQELMRSRHQGKDIPMLENWLVRYRLLKKWFREGRLNA